MENMAWQWAAPKVTARFAVAVGQLIELSPSNNKKGAQPRKMYWLSISVIHIHTQTHTHIQT